MYLCVRHKKNRIPASGGAVIADTKNPRFVEGSMIISVNSYPTVGMDYDMLKKKLMSGANSRRRFPGVSFFPPPPFSSSSSSLSVACPFGAVIVLRFTFPLLYCSPMATPPRARDAYEDRAPPHHARPHVAG